MIERHNNKNKDQSKIKTIRLIAHNAQYDMSFLLPYLFNVKEVNNKGQFMQLKASYKYSSYGTYNIIIKDSLKLIPEKLSKFPKMFFNETEEKTIKKEIYPYKFFTSDNFEKYKVNNRLIVPLEEITQKKYFNVEDRKHITLFINNCKELKIIDKHNNVDIIKYASFYCEQDCNILRRGYNTFKTWIYNLCELDIDNIISAASLSHKYLLKKNCYIGVYELSKIPRLFIEKCVCGGRTMSNNNEKQYYNYFDILKSNLDNLSNNIVINKQNINEKFEEQITTENFKKKYTMSDFDGVSLYPSAMVRIPGLLRGIPKILKTTNYNDIKNYDGYFVEIDITKVNKNLDFPLINSVDVNGIRQFKNDNIKMYVDKTMLEDLIKYHNIEFNIIRGYYFDQGFNKNICEAITELFELRLKAKKEGNKIEQVYKLIMNSAYGKTILKESHEQIIYVKKDDINKFIENKYNFVKTYSKIMVHDNNFYNYRVVMYKSISDHYNIPQVGVSILSMSKRIMNEVMCLAQDLGIKIYYQDTDSMHLITGDIEKLEKAYNDINKRLLIGKKFGQFHTDFNLSDNFYTFNNIEEYENDKDKIKVNDIYSIENITLGKKSYIDKLIVLCKEKDEAKQTLGENNNYVDKIYYDYHIRLKGIPNNTILYYCNNNNIDPIELYKKLYNGESIEFDLLNNGENVKFQKSKSYKYSFKTSFQRRVKF
jgi:hypothetical protein